MKAEIERCISKCQGRILTLAQAALPDSQYQAFRTLVLDEFGKRGLASELDKLFADSKHKQER